MHFLSSSIIGLFLLLRSSATPQNLLQQPLQVPTTSSKRTINDSPLLSLHRSLIQHDSVTLGNEPSVGNFLVDYLEKLNLTVHKQYVPPLSLNDISSETTDSPRRFNIYAHFPGHSNSRILLTSHIDTVPPFFNYSIRAPGSTDILPEDAEINENTEIYGRGSNDDKSCVAAQITVIEEAIAASKSSELRSSDISPTDLSLLLVVGEEAGGDGMRFANNLGLTPEVMIFGEPTESKLVSGHKGIMQFFIHVNGTAAHSGYPWLGKSANEVLIKAVSALEALKQKEGLGNGGLPWTEKYGASTLNVGYIQGGVAGNVVAEKAEAKVTIRLAGGPLADVRAVVLDAINEATKEILADGKATLEVKFLGEAYLPVDIDTDIDGFEKTTVNYGTDIPNWHGKQKSYLYGPGSILVAHSDHEHLTVGELERSVEDYKRIIRAVS